MKNPKYQIFMGKDDQFYFHLQAANGRIIQGSEGYTAKAGCLKGIEAVRQNAPHDGRYRRETAADGSFYFVLVAANGEPVGTGETYTTAQARDEGIEAVKRIAPEAPVEDTTAS